MLLVVYLAYVFVLSDVRVCTESNEYGQVTSQEFNSSMSEWWLVVGSCGWF